jgi:predicted ribosome quality control (RQC) complex YloA/Tae2 family protein
MASRTFCEKRRKLLRSIRRRLQRLEHGLEKSKKVLQESKEWEKIEHSGQLLKANFSRLGFGLKEITLEDWQDGGKKIIPLDPSLSPQEQLEAYFRKVKKLKRAGKPLEKAITEQKKEICHWENVKKSIELSQSDEELLNIQKSQSQKGQKTGKKEEKVPYYTFISTSGCPLLVGKTARGNDFLTLQIARSKDLWFHSRGKGAHVILKMKKEVSREDILDGCMLALYFSPARSELEKEYEVIYTERNNVRKMKKSPPGLVLATNTKTVRLSIDPERIAKIKKRSK